MFCFIFKFLFAAAGFLLPGFFSANRWEACLRCSFFSISWQNISYYINQNPLDLSVKNFSEISFFLWVCTAWCAVASGWFGVKISGRKKYKRCCQTACFRLVLWRKLFFSSLLARCYRYHKWHAFWASQIWYRRTVQVVVRWWPWARGCWWSNRCCWSSGCWVLMTSKASNFQLDATTTKLLGFWLHNHNNKCYLCNRVFLHFYMNDPLYLCSNGGLKKLHTYDEYLEKSGNWCAAWFDGLN